MARLLRLTFLIVALFASSVALVSARPYINPAVAFFGADDCEMPCWQGIQFGVTPADEARAALDANPWVYRPPTSARLASPYTLWLWTDSFPYPQRSVTNNRAVHLPDALLGTGSSARLNASEPVATGISLGTGLSLADVWLLLGPPTSFSIGRVAMPSNMVMSVRLIGMGGKPGIVADAYQSCPLTRETLWDSPVSIQMTAPALAGTTPQVEYVTDLLELLERADLLYCP